MIPKLSAPTTKLIRTGEGVVLFAFNIAALLGTVVNDLSPGTALKYAAIFNAVAFASRQLLKGIAVTQPYLGGAPITPELLTSIQSTATLAAPAAETVLGDVVATEKIATAKPPAKP